ncbi:Histo-blood group ABO system transferase 1 [Camelus dromedarius]|uniref:Histo-blood group ABO system transferase 1 n=1 Tax=Camelus dromedarius TaxID=9838 RepID=A0A5N4DUW9_CAMDR|nr:Histo-blood group ABO system transferase 1 [Camelus dromedarius]
MIYLNLFLETAEMYFIMGHRVNYYIFTDQPDYVPHIHLQKGRQIVILKVQSYVSWQEVIMHHMEMISNFIEQRFQQEVDYLVCADVDMVFSDHVGVEILSSLFSILHSNFFVINWTNFPYEQWPQSQAYIPEDDGDFYYSGALFGGSVPEVYKLTKACHEAMMVDQANDIQATWHEESHLNRYQLYHKPTKVLSPEYTWDEQTSRAIWDKQVLGLPYNTTQINYQIITMKSGLTKGSFQKGLKEVMAGSPSLPPGIKLKSVLQERV